MDLGGVDFALKYVVGSPGHMDRRPLHECVESAKGFGLVRDFPMRLPKALLPRDSEIHYEMFGPENRLVVVRATASDCLAMDDSDCGNAIIDQSVFMCLPEHQVRYFLIDICPVPAREIWLRPYMDRDGRFRLKCRDWTWEGPSSLFADSLWLALQDIVERKKWKDYCHQASLLRIAMMKKLSDGESVDLAKVRVPPMTRGRWYPDMIDHALLTATRTLRLHANGA